MVQMEGGMILLILHFPLPPSTFPNNGFASNLASLIFSAQTIPIPEPETYAMLLARLGLLGFVARRRKQKAA
jgi:hypothetical protein